MRIGLLFVAGTVACVFSAGRSADGRVDVRQIEIHSAWQGWGSEKTDVVIRRLADGRYLSGSEAIPKRLVNDLVLAMREPVVRAPELRNCGITAAWLRANAASALRQASRPLPPRASETAEFMSNFQNPTRMSEIVAETFCGRLSELRRSQLIARSARSNGRSGWSRRESRYAAHLNASATPAPMRAESAHSDSTPSCNG